MEWMRIRIGIWIETFAQSASDLLPLGMGVEDAGVAEELIEKVVAHLDANNEPLIARAQLAEACTTTPPLLSFSMACTPDPPPSKATPTQVYSIAFNPNGTQLISGSPDGPLHL